MRYIKLPENIETKVFVLDNGAINAVPEVLNTAFPGRKIQIVADGNTWQAAGEKIARLCSEKNLESYPPIILPAVPKPHQPGTVCTTKRGIPGPGHFFPRGKHPGGPELPGGGQGGFHCRNRPEGKPCDLRLPGGAQNLYGNHRGLSGSHQRRNH